VSVFLQGVDAVVDTGLNDLRLILKRYNEEPSSTMKSAYLSVISSLFTFLKLAKDANRFEEDHLLLMNAVFSSIFACFTPGEMTEPEYELRVHASALLIKVRSPGRSLKLDSVYLVSGNQNSRFMYAACLKFNIT